MRRDLVVREARAEEHGALGRLMVSVYAKLEGFPGPDQQPGYYQTLENVGQLAARPATRILVAVADGAVIGGVVCFLDMAQYGSGGSATGEDNAAGFRLLAVDPRARGMGVGKALVGRCVELARESKRSQVILHTTSAMKVAWGMYEQMGFVRSPDLDFMQGQLPVSGFRLQL